MPSVVVERHQCGRDVVVSPGLVRGFEQARDGCVGVFPVPGKRSVDDRQHRIVCEHADEAVRAEEETITGGCRAVENLRCRRIFEPEALGEQMGIRAVPRTSRARLGLLSICC